MEAFWNALVDSFTVGNVFLSIVATFAGIVIGAIPGLSATMAVAILIPFTYKMGTIASLAMLLGVYCGAVYGGSISAILLNIPGTPAAIMTTLDGNPMAKKGEGGRAIGVSTIASFCGGIISCVFLIVCCSLLALVAQKFSYPEYFVLAAFGICLVADSCGESFLKGIVSGLIGILLSLVGMDALTGQQRFTFGNPYLLGGLGQVPALIGLFGMSEILNQVFELGVSNKKKMKVGRVVPDKPTLKRLVPTIIRGSLIGTFIGALPGAGGPVAASIAYNTEKTTSKDPSKFGTGIPEGVAAAESANNAVTGGAIIPMLALAVPGDGTTAVLMSAFIIKGIDLGPMIFSQHPEVVNTTYIFLILGNIFMLILGLSLAKIFAKVIEVDNKILLPVVLLICMVGTFASASNTFNIYVMIFFGILGFVMQRFKFSLTPMILGLVLGSMAEENFRSALTMSKGDYSVFFRPISLVFIVIAAVILAWPRVKRAINKRKSADSNGSDAA